MGRRLTLKPSKGLPRRLEVEQCDHLSAPWQVVMFFRSHHCHTVFAVGDKVRLDEYDGTYCLWVDRTAFQVLEHEARAIAEFAQIRFPVSPAAAGGSSPSPRSSAVAGPSKEIHG